MFSIIIPLYNKENYIIPTLKSLLRQSYDKFEIILVNDGSTDNSLSLVKEYINDPRLKLINIKNNGVSNARNVGIQNAKYDWLCFLDADDFWHIDYLIKAQDIIKQENEIEVIAFNYYKYYDDFRKKIMFDKKSGFLNSYLTFNCMSSSSVVIKKKVFDEIGYFNTQIFYGEDQHMWLRISNQKKIYYINNPLAYYRMNDHVVSLSKYNSRILNNDLLFYISEMTIIDPYWEIYKNNYIANYLKPYYICDNHYRASMILLKKVNFRKTTFMNFLFYNFPRYLVKFFYKKYFIYKYS